MGLKLYALAARLAAPWLRQMLRGRVEQGKEIAARLPEREGITTLPRPAGRVVWVHAASVGETMSVLPLIELLAPRVTIVLTTGTVTSAELAATRLPANALHQFVPLDVPAWGKRFLDHWRPDVAVFLESELWPNLLTALDKRRIKRFLINGRMSAQSVRTWRFAPATARHLLGGFAAIHAQSAGDAARFRALGAASVVEWGNLKFAAAPLAYDEAALATLQNTLSGPVWLASSTHPGEEALVYTVHQALVARWPELVSIIVPRHPARGAEIAALCGQAPRRAAGQMPIPGQVYVADTLGELGLFYRLAPFAFVGNSLVGHGGHNIIEPACLARAVLCGPHLENFVEAAAQLQAAQALREVTNAQTFQQAVEQWLHAPHEAIAAGARAKSAFMAVEGLSERLARLILGDVS